MKIGGTGDVTGPQRIRPPGNGGGKPPETPSAASGGAGADSVQISGTARLIAAMSRVPDVRQEKVAAARESIAAGQMDTPERWNVAVDRLIEDMLGE